MILDRSTENIKEIVWSDINAVLDEIADYYLKKFDNPNNIRESLLRQFESAVTNELSGINLEDYLRTNNCSLELVAKYNKLLQIKSDFFGGKIKVVKEVPKKEVKEIIFDKTEPLSIQETSLEDIKEKVVTVKEDESKIEVEEEKVSKEEHKPTNIENYIKEMEEKLKEREKEKEVVRASIDPNATIEEIEEDYSAIAELLGDEEIVVKFKENE